MMPPSPCLTAKRAFPEDSVYQTLLTWPFADEPFYEAQVLRLLRDDIPQRCKFGYGQVWQYRDLEGNSVGFGVLDISKEYEHFSNGKHHSYIPLLAVHLRHHGKKHRYRTDVIPGALCPSID